LSNTAGFSDEWIPVHPATDGAVALAMGNVILSEDLQDSDFINNWTNVSVAELKAHYKQYTPEWASKISGVPVETIERIAREFATTKPVLGQSRIYNHLAGPRELAGQILHPLQGGRINFF